MYPLLLKAPVKDYLWGGTKLKTEYGFETDREIAAEAWTLSCHKDGCSTVMNGEFMGKSLPEVLKVWGDDAIGKNAAAFPYFPLLIKLIDARDRLSVQVHPDDEYALKNEGEYGKTEMWYVVDCEEKAELIYGFKRSIDKDEFKKRIENNTLTKVCNTVPVKKGDVFFISAGTLHAIGKGILIAEVQQNSNTTYRVSDYGRLGADGEPRALHIEKALDVTKSMPPEKKYGNIGKTEKTAYGTKRRLAECHMFTADIISLSGDFCARRSVSFTTLLFLNGSAEISWNGGSLQADKGSSIFIPAGLKTHVKGNAEILCSYI